MKKREYPPVFEPNPEQVYGISLLGGLKDDGTRWSPKIFDKKKTREDGSTYFIYWTNTVIYEINIVDGKTEKIEIGERTWFIPHQIIDEVKDLFDNNKFKFMFRKNLGISDKGKPSFVYEVKASMKEFTKFQEKAFDVKPKAQFTPMPHHMSKDDAPFDDDMGDDEVAFKEDIVDLTQIAKTLEGIEKHLENLSSSFNEMLNKFTVKIKKVKD